MEAIYFIAGFAIFAAGYVTGFIVSRLILRKFEQPLGNDVVIDKSAFRDSYEKLLAQSLPPKKKRRTQWD